jgi:hypothetical protein
MQAIGGAVEAPTFSTWFIPNLGVIDLDTTELQSNDQEIFEAVAERVLRDLVELGVEVPRATTSVVAASADERASSSGALVPGAAAAEQTMLGQGGDVGGPMPSVAPSAVEGVLKEPVAGVESAVIAPPLPTVGVDAPHL